MGLLVFYDSRLTDSNRDSYLKAISSKIEDVKMIDVASEVKINERVNINTDKVLLVEPLGTMIKTQIEKYFRDYPQLDVEGTYTGKLTITAEAILRVLGNVNNQEIVVTNQSKILGKPLAIELIKRGANVHSLNRTGNVLSVKRADWLITATGDDDFEFNRNILMKFKKIVDLSNDTPLKKSIRKVPTLEVLEERLERDNNENKYRKSVLWM